MSPSARQMAAALMLISMVLPGCAASSSQSDPAAHLIERLEAVDQPVDFSFAFRAGGTRVNDCFLPNREFVGEVDAARDLLLSRRTDGRTPLVVSTDDATFLAAELFGERDVPTSWVRLFERGPNAIEPLTRLIGPDLAAFDASEELPPSGHATALAALGAARGMEVRGASVIGGSRSDGFRVSLDPVRYAGEPLASDAMPVPDGPPEIDLWISKDDEVIRVEVRPPAVETSANHDEPPPGWVTDYDHSPRDIEFELPPDATRLTPSELSTLSPRRLASCNLPI